MSCRFDHARFAVGSDVLGLVQRLPRRMVWLGLASVLVVSLGCVNGLGGPAAATSTPTLVPATEPPLTGTSTPTPAVSISDRDILIALYEATGGANWSDDSNWLSDAPIGEWHGVTTNGSGRVTELDFSGNQLSGEIPPELDNLTNLTALVLFYNELTGTIPAELGDLANLRGLYLSGNELSGEIPPELVSTASQPRQPGRAVPRPEPVKRGDTAGVGQPRLPDEAVPL